MLTTLHNQALYGPSHGWVGSAGTGMSHIPGTRVQDLQEQSFREARPFL